MKRSYEQLIGDQFARNRQMAFLSGPRQVGKTTLSGMLLPDARYYTYDNPADARKIGAGPDCVAEDSGLDRPSSARRSIIFDEIHKFPKWKRFLKGFFDLYGKGTSVAVTGSARLSVYKRGGDSLMGRYFPYRIHPLSVGELTDGDLNLDELFRGGRKIERSDFESLLRFGGYPEPFLSGSDRFHNRWKNAHRDLVLYEDLRDLSRVQDIRGIGVLVELLAARVTGGINYSNLAQDLQVAPDTVKTWIELLESVYEIYTIRPWSKNVSNSIRKQPKIYFWDWSAVTAGGMRNENFIASHLLKSVQWWTDAGLGKFELCYVRDKQQHEVDFLISRDDVPFILVECKTSAEDPLSPNLERYRNDLKVPYAFQVAIDGKQESINPFDYKDKSIRISAADLLSVLI